LFSIVYKTDKKKTESLCVSDAVHNCVLTQKAQRADSKVTFY